MAWDLRLGSPLVTNVFPPPKFEMSFIVNLSKPYYNQSCSWRFGTLWRPCDVTVMPHEICKAFVMLFFVDDISRVQDYFTGTGVIEATVPLKIYWQMWVQAKSHYDDVIMTMLASQITSLTVVYSIVYSGVNQRKHQSPASLAFVWEIHRGPVNFPHKWPVTRKMFPFDDVIMVSNHNKTKQTQIEWIFLRIYCTSINWGSFYLHGLT